MTENKEGDKSGIEEVLTKWKQVIKDKVLTTHHLINHCQIHPFGRPNAIT